MSETAGLRSSLASEDEKPTILLNSTSTVTAERAREDELIVLTLIRRPLRSPSPESQAVFYHAGYSPMHRTPTTISILNSNQFFDMSRRLSAPVR